MTLTALRIANFKAFGATQRIPLRPITLLYGANSAGKSSILHALALAHHAIETGELDTQRTQIGGESIDLGGFRQFVHRRQRDQQVELGFELDPARLTGRVAELLPSAREVLVEVAFGAGAVGDEAALFDDPARGVDRRGGVRVERFALGVDGSPLLSMSARAGGILRLDRLDHAHPVFREVFRGLLMLATTTQQVHEEDFDALGEVLDALVPAITARARGLFPRIEEQSESTDAEDQESAALLPVSRGHRHEDLARAARLFLPKALRDLVGGLGAALEHEIRRLSYLGPLRSYPPRHLAFSQDHDPNWFAGGGYAWDLVRQREDVRRKINAWLGSPERLKTPYELVVHDLVALDQMSRPVEEALEALAEDGLDLQADYDRDPEPTGVFPIIKDPEAEVARIIESVAASDAERITELVLMDLRTRTQVSHRDVGIGVSQVLPVLVSAYASTGKLLAIEQPEIHLHPALQAELGDVLLESALGEGDNTFLIETHSEHLLLRIMRRMRETRTGKLPEGMTEVRPEDVMVLFVEPDGPRSIVREMPLNELGELVKAWPGGFFEEGLREIF